MNQENWDNSKIQFPRLLAEINAIGLNPCQIQKLSESMDLSTDEIKNIFDKANCRWEVEKAWALGDTSVFVNCPSCNYGVLERTDMEEYYEIKTKCKNCKRNVIIDENGNIS